MVNSEEEREAKTADALPTERQDVGGRIAAEIMGEHYPPMVGEIRIGGRIRFYTQVVGIGRDGDVEELHRGVETPFARTGNRRTACQRFLAVAWIAGLAPVLRAWNSNVPTRRSGEAIR